MNDSDFVAELERRWNVNESLYAERKIVEKKYKENQAFFKKIAATIEQNRELQLKAMPDIMTDNFIQSFLRELNEYGLRPVFTANNEVRLFKQDFTAFNE